MFPGPLGGRYAVQHELAKGGYGRVYLAEDLKLGRPVAVKIVIPSPHVSMEEAIRRLEREARVAGAITHPNVCSVSDIGRLPDGLPFVVMELLTGETLAVCLWREKTLAVDVALDFAQQMLSGLEAAHRRGIIHRDVKPENMFLTQLAPGKRLLKVLDFGTAQMPGSDSPHGETLTRAGHVIGTMQYMSPEQLKGVRHFDARTDVYSSAVVIYEMLTGRRPFHDVPDDVVAQAIAFSQPPSIASRVPGLPPPLARVIDMALSVDHKRRPADASAFLEALRKPSFAASGATKILVQQHQSSPPSPPSPPSPSSPPAPMHSVGIVTPGSDWDVPTRHALPRERPVAADPVANAAFVSAAMSAAPSVAPGTERLISAKTTESDASDAADWELPTRQMSPPSEDDEWDLKTTETGPREGVPSSVLDIPISEGVLEDDEEEERATLLQRPNGRRR